MNRTSLLLRRDPDQVRNRLERAAARFEAACDSSAEWPDLDAYLDEADDAWRNDLLVELIYADLELRLRFGKPSRLTELLAKHFPSGPPAEIEAELRLRERELVEVWNAVSQSAADQFTLGGELGRGATSIVYQGFDERHCRTVAYKRLRSDLLDSGGAVRRFLREARCAVRLRHPGIVRLFEAGFSADGCFLVMELVPGETLAQRLAAGRFTPRRAAELVSRVADALEYAHAQGIVHRDVKPSNILLDAGGLPRLSDFGLATAARSAGDCTLTEDGQILGTPAYMSPEQARGDVRRVDRRSDVYSLGVVLYELLSGSVPFRGVPRMVLTQVIEDDPRPLRRLDDAIPRELETICLKAVAKDPGRRYQRAGDLAADLRRWLDGRPISARPLGAATKLWLKCRRHPALSGLAAALILTLGGLAEMDARARIHLEEARRQAAQLRARMNESSRIERLLASMIPASSAPGFNAARMELAIDRLKKQIARVEGDPKYRDVFARDLVTLRLLYDLCGRTEEAAAVQRRAVHAIEDLAKDAGGAADAAQIVKIAGAASRLADLLARSGRADESRMTRARTADLDERARASWRSSGETESGPGDSFQRAQRLWSLLRLADFKLSRSRVDEAVSLFSEIVAFAGPRPPRVANLHWVESSLRLSRDLHGQGRSEEAVRLLEAADEVCRALAARDETDERLLAAAGRCLLESALIHDQGGDRDAAARTFRIARARADALIDLGRSSGRSRGLIARHLATLAQRAESLSGPDAAILAFNQALEFYQATRSEPGNLKAALAGAATCHHVIGRIHADQGRLVEARRALRAALEIRRDILQNHAPTKCDEEDFQGTQRRLDEVQERLDKQVAAVRAEDRRNVVTPMQSFAAGLSEAASGARILLNIPMD